jgi:hypothetical protein
MIVALPSTDQQLGDVLMILGVLTQRIPQTLPNVTVWARASMAHTGTDVTSSRNGDIDDKGHKAGRADCRSSGYANCMGNLAWSLERT